MNIVQVTPGAGGMYCGGCFRDNALVRAWRQQGHEALMVPLYLPLTLDEPNQSAGTPTFFGGINVYLEQKSAWFRRMPAWLHRWLDAPALLRLAGRFGGQTRPADVSDLMISMLRGEEGNQARELDELLNFLGGQARPAVVCLSNALLLGLARRLRRELKAPLVCLLSGEDTFLDGLPPSHREQAWSILSARAREVDAFIAPSRYFADLMQRRLQLRPEQVHVIANGISVEGYGDGAGGARSGPPVLGYFARMCREKGLDLLVDAYGLLRRRGRVGPVRLHVGGGLGPSDEPLVQDVRERLRREGYEADVAFFPNVDRAEKVRFFQSLTVFSTPALYGEAFGLYLLEAMAAGVPVVQPRHAAFPEVVEQTGGGVVAEPTAAGLAEALEGLLLDPIRLRRLGDAGRQAVRERYTVERVAERYVTLFGELGQAPAVGTARSSSAGGSPEN